MTTPFSTDVPITNCGYDPYPYGTAESTCVEADHVYQWDIEMCFQHDHLIPATYTGCALVDNGYCTSPGGEFNAPNQKVLGRSYPRLLRYWPEGPLFRRTTFNNGTYANCSCTELVNGVEEPLKSWTRSDGVLVHGQIVVATCSDDDITDSITRQIQLPMQVCSFEDPEDYFRSTLSWGVVGGRIFDQYGNSYEIDPAGFPHTGFLDNLP